MCGEKSHSVSPAVAAQGSPPHVRGKGGDGNDRGLHARITPAYAGKSSRLTKYCRATQDHPRVCGEKADAQYQLPIMQGSPPRMRGKAAKSVVSLCSPWITPAYAGKRLKRSHSIGHFSCILCLFHSVLHRASVSGGSRAGRDGSPAGQPQNAGPA